MRRAFCLLGLLLTPQVAAQVSFGPPVQVDTGGIEPANETTVAISAADPRRLLVAWNDYRTGSARMGVGTSFDGGLTWNDSLLRPPFANQTPDEGDPMTAFDARTGKLWAGAIAFGAGGGVYVAALDHGATSFQPSVMAHLTAAADKGWMAAGPAPGNPGATNLYIAYNQGLLRSFDEGKPNGIWWTWLPG